MGHVLGTSADMGLTLLFDFTTFSARNVILCCLSVRMEYWGILTALLTRYQNVFYVSVAFVVCSTCLDCHICFLIQARVGAL